MAEMNAALRAEGQRTVIIGDRSTVHNDASRSAGVRMELFVNTVTKNADGSVGYQLEGNRPRAEASTEVCVRAKLENVTLYDARLPRVSANANLGGAFNDLVRQNASVGTRPMVIADTVHRNSDGTSRRGLPLVVFGNMAQRGGALVTALPNLQPQRLGVLVNLDYAPSGLSELAGPALASARTPN